MFLEATFDYPLDYSQPENDQILSMTGPYNLTPVLCSPTPNLEHPILSSRPFLPPLIALAKFSPPPAGHFLLCVLTSSYHLIGYSLR